MAQSASPASTGSADESAESLALTKQLMAILQTPAMVRLLAASNSAGGVGDGSTQQQQQQQQQQQHQQQPQHQQLQVAVAAPARTGPPSPEPPPTRTEGAVASIFLHSPLPDPDGVKANYAALHAASTSTSQAVLHDFADDPAVHAFLVCVEGATGVEPHLQLLLAPRRVHVPAAEGGTNSPLHGVTYVWTDDVIDGELPPTVALEPAWLVPGGDVVLPKIEAVDSFTAAADPTIGLIPAAAVVPETPKAAGGGTPSKPPATRGSGTRCFGVRRRRPSATPRSFFGRQE